MGMLKIEVSEFELSLLLGLVLEQRITYEEKLKDLSWHRDTVSLAESFKGLHEKLHRAKPIADAS